MMGILTSLNIDLTSRIDDSDYKNLIKIIAFPIYAANPSKNTINSKNGDYDDFTDRLTQFLNDREEPRHVIDEK